MTMPFPGTDPYLEHPILWEGVHARMIVAMANQLQPRLDPRYVTSIEERVFIEGRAVLEQVYQEGRYTRRVKYDQPCEPPLSPNDQAWADDCLRRFAAQMPTS